MKKINRKKYSYSKNKHCKCGKLITNRAIRCGSCGAEKRQKNPKNVSSFIDGRTLKKYYCSDCKKEITMGGGYYGKGKCASCAKKGDLNPLFIDGKSHEPYTSDFNDKLKEQIKRRDNYECQGEKCSMTQEEHFIVYGRDLEIHHIDYNKTNCKEENLITLCKQCNLRANSNRDYWSKYFNFIIIKLKKENKDETTS